MRKAIKIFLLCSIFLWVGTFIGIVSAGGFYHNIVLVVCGIIAVFMAIFTLVLGMVMTNSGLDRDWFKTQEQLQERLIKSNEQYDLFQEVFKVLGENEAIKLWQNSKENETKTS